MGEQCTRVGIRLTPTAKKALEYIASHLGISCSELFRRYANACLTGQPDDQVMLPPDKPLPSLDDTEGWRTTIERWKRQGLIE